MIEMFTKDHLIARSLGGQDRINNIRPICMEHNNLKSEFESDIKRELIRSWKCQNRVYIPESVDVAPSIIELNRIIQYGSTIRTPLCA